MVDKERRLSPRIKDEALTVKLDIGGFDSVTHTLDISSSGVYCKVDKEIPLMSRINLVLVMPDAGAQKGITVEGVVVREHPVIIDGVIKHYDVAIFFDNLSQKNKDLISEYIARKKKT